MMERDARCSYPTASFLCLLIVLIAGSGAGGVPKQYVVLNIAPGEVKDTVFAEVGQVAGGRASAGIGLGIGTIFSYLHQPRDKVRAQLEEFLSLAERFNMPIVVQLDGEQWWGGRPDLWNWWDPGRPGYSPENRGNVEWSGWGPGDAIKIAWRNWGRQIRVLPPPNLMSHRYREACHDEMRVLVPVVLKWWRELPKEKKHLLIGIKLGWESSIGVNSFYYPDGNALLDQPEEEDPTSGVKGDQVPDRGVAAIGYAAVMTSGLARSGELQESHLAEVVRLHLNDLCELAAGLGTPREKLFTHVAGWKDEELLYDAALNKYACPGWSFYRYAGDPTQDKGVQRALGKSDASWWAAVEWLLAGNRDEDAWRTAMGRTLSDPKCRYLCIYNWSGIKDNRAAIKAIRGLLGGREEESMNPAARAETGQDRVAENSGSGTRNRSETP